MRLPPFSRLPYLAAVALVAAALADPLVETVANTGILGRGYADNDHSSVIPTLIVGAVLTLLVIGARSWTLALARYVVERSPLDDLPYVIGFQFVALFIMESAEQFFAGGHVLGGMAWFGGPVWFSIITHVIVGVSCSLLIARGMRTIVRRCAAIVSLALDLILCRFGRATANLFARRRYEAALLRAQRLHIRQLGERAPPLLLATLF